MLDTRKSRLTAFMTLVQALLALYAASAGVLDKNIYEAVFSAGTISRFLVFGSIAQDIVTVPLAAVLAALSLVFLKRPGYKVFIVMLGTAGYLFYGYGLYVIQGQYTSLYPVYLAVFGLGLYSLALGLTSFEPEAVNRTRLPKTVRVLTGSFLLIILLVLVPAWLARMAPDIAKHAPGQTYGVFVLDLAVVFPALAVIAVLLLRARPFGNILAGVALVKVLTVCLSVAAGEWFVSSRGGFPVNYDMVAIFSGLTVFSLILGLVYLRSLEAAGQGRPPY